jgi:hypothetical protein
MIRHWPSTLMILGTLPFLIGGVAHAQCLTTLGTDDCFRAADPTVQAMEHHYLDPRRDHSPARPRRHLRAKVSSRVPSQ